MAAKVSDFPMALRSRASALLRMSRPLILMAAVLANLAGLSMANYEMGSVDLGRAIMGMMIVLLATAMGHYLNEYSDIDTDFLSRRTPISGGSGVLPSGIIPPSWALLGGLLLGFSSLLLTIFGFLEGLLSVSFLIMVSFGLILGYSYSMPPLQLERRGWGELDNAFLGTLMFFTGYLPQTGELSATAVVRSVPIFLAIMVNLIGIHWADLEADEAVGKRTMVVRLKGRSMILFPLLMAATYSSVLIAVGSYPMEMLIAYLLTIPVAAYAYLEFRRTGSPFPGSFFMVAILVVNMIGWLV